MENRAGFVDAAQGKKCHGLRRQDYYYRGEFVPDSVLLYLQTAPDTWLRFFFDAGLFFWSIVQAPSIPEKADDFDWRLEDLSSTYDIVGREIHMVAFRGDGGIGNNELTMSLSDGACLSLRNENDSSFLTYSKVDA